jgi:hypothetical protein
VIRTRLAVGLAASLSLLVPTAAHAGDPILPLAQVQSGMDCTGYSVIRGTDIASFGVHVVDVVAGIDPQILVTVSGPAVDETGIGQGFSGSPVKCVDPADGVAKTIGAIAQGTGDYGNKLVLVTPIQTMLGDSVDPPVSAKAMPASLRRKARALATPLSFSGVSGPVAAALTTAGRRLGRALYAAPAAPRAVTFGVQTLQPGSAVAVGLASGDIQAGVIGTVTYVDGNSVWAFGHPLDGAGRRSLLLQDAYVYTVVNNPIDASLGGGQEVTSYKLAAPGHDLGTLTNDAPDGVVGRLGALPATFPLRVTGTDLDSGRVIHLNSQIADETPVGQPTGVSSLTQVGPVAVAQAAYDVLRGAPVRQSGSMCVRITVRERQAPLRFCNTYVGGSPTGAGAPQAADMANGLALLDTYNFGNLHITGVDVNLKLRRELRQAYVLGATGPRRAHRGQDIAVKLAAQRIRGAKLTRMVTVHIPRSLAKGRYVLELTGSPADASAGAGEGQDLASTFTISLGDDSGEATDDPGPRNLAELAAEFGSIGRDDGITARFRDSDDSDSVTSPVVVLRDPQLRFSGAAKLRVTVRP